MSVRYEARVAGDTLADIETEANEIVKAFFGYLPGYDLDIDSKTINTLDGQGHIVKRTLTYNATVTVKT